MLREKIQTVENHLMPAVVIQGRPQPPLNLADRMVRYHVPGISVAVIHDTAVEWAQGYGVVEEGGAPVTPETRFQAASISKPVTALASLHQVQAGALDLDTDVNEALRSWQVPGNEHTHEHPVTLRGLLSHTAGLTVHGFKGYTAGDEIPSLQQILDGAPPANSDPIRVDQVPGSKSRYSGGGYVVLQQLLQDVAGRPFPELMRATVLDPLGMEHSTFEQPLPQRYTGQAATGHRGSGQPLTGRWRTHPELAAAGLWTTPTDLARVAIEIVESWAGSRDRLLSPEMVQQMLTPHLDDYGLGIGVKTVAGTPRFSHGGSNAGFRCLLVAYTGRGQGAVVMANGDNGEDLAMEVLRSIAHVYGWPDLQPQERAVAPVDPDLYVHYEGRYQFVEYPEYGVLVTREADCLWMQALPAGLCVQLWPVSETTYFVAENGQEISFLPNAGGRIDILRAGKKWELRRVE